jgi:hypothetical protein
VNVETGTYQSKNGKIKAYMVFSDTAGSQESACLIFARTAKTARKLGYGVGWWDDWLDIAVHWIKDNPQIFREADQEKLQAGIAHVIEEPKLCRRCGFWGDYLDDNDICEDCRER